MGRRRIGASWFLALDARYGFLDLDNLLLKSSVCRFILELLRIMMDPITGDNKRFAFVTYTNKFSATEAAAKVRIYLGK